MLERGEIRTLARALTLVETDDLDDVTINDLINQGVREVGMLHPWPFLQKEDTIALVTDQASYPLPADFNRIELVIGDDGEELDETTRREAQKRWLGAPGGTPSEFYLWQEQIVFAPTPSASAIDIVQLDYLREPTVLTLDADNPEWYSAFHFNLVHYVASKIWEREEDFQRANYYYGKFRREVDIEMVDHYRNRSKDQPLIVGGDHVERFNPQRPYMTWPHMQ